VFWKRLLSALIGIPLLLAAVWYGGIFLFLLTTVLMLLGAWEISRIFARIELHLPPALLLTGCTVLLLAAYRWQHGYPGTAVLSVLLLYLLAMLLLYPRLKPIDVAVAFFSTMYVGLIIYLYLLSTLADGWVWLLFMLLCTWASDTAAFLVGRKAGRRQIAPALSPAKTLEGAAGGVAGSFLTALLVALLYPQFPVLPVLILGILVGFGAQAGDLVESAIKRQVGIKDAGKLIPGHGGILDRFDSMLFTAPLVYYYVGLIITG